MRPATVVPRRLDDVLASLPSSLPAPVSVASAENDGASTLVSGVTIDSRQVVPGDLYIAVPGTGRHGADFTAQAVAAGAAAVLTDDDGVPAASAALGGSSVPLYRASPVRDYVGPLAGVVFESQPATGKPVLYGVTGTNGKTTTTYFLNALSSALGRSTGLIGTIEIRAGDMAIPSILTTPESPQVHGILGLMRERGIDAAAMEVSSHAIEYRRVDGVRFDVVGFTNLTQDHLDLHGSMEEYYAAKAALFRSDRAVRAVVTVDDPWGRRLAAETDVEVLTLSVAGTGPADWKVVDLVRDGLGHAFTLCGPDGVRLRLRCGLPGTFNVANAALAAVMVLASGVDADELQQAADGHDPFTTQVPGRMQLVGERPAAIVDFAHNPDALALTLESVRVQGSDSRVLVVFGATGQRDISKRPIMGATAARRADVVIVTDDDPHDEDDAVIRAGVLEGALKAQKDENLHCEILEIFPRAAAIDRAVALAREGDVVLVAGRGHEVWQEVKGVNLPLDDRVELAAALTRHGFSALPGNRIES
ncbi:UDP-N-acetylmuramoyl-L-alanyl-D-glutamate--2,6-diaminopimelate ligase [Arthrobacter sp. JZ12]|uniref:UDP-N-acetylmuramoyl-L-alanyl-D-glutamate--2, 6-diaminopimelate ligase n=1 Tax=Arthrobacter sp. JZ12 TaxID=2654190 RepID=UPI002B4A29A5|nr:UDP-N-acetylmuramoyl-L-alanyl-D-glutamate--2,6-diaminopimelate ligase [Arthrobacter sp. JZ12]WRH26435.1 UDP-N-acetylmuramoyl-L-alanyl-D-glutamate--2,6-diaminopimelate ligase [Arthrobacter sp. JZ12]